YLSSACYCCTDAAITETSSLSLHDALPISVARRRRALEGGSAARSSGDSEGRGRCLRLPGIRPGSLDHRHRPGGRRRRFQPSDMVMLTDRTYFVTGAAGGIGAATATLIVERGGSVVVADVDPGGREVADRLGERALWTACDVTDVGAVDRAVTAAIEHFGRLHGAVSAAGMVRLDTAWEADVSDFDRQLHVNVTGTFNVARRVGERLREAGGGAIVNVASNCGKVGYANMAAYNASKAAVINLTRSLALEWAGDGININSVCPGGVD